jgi:propionate CoA-transferase
MSPREAANLIPDNAVIATSGLGGNQRASILYWAIRETFQETRHPANLTLISTGGQGGRGIVPGTVEELGLKGLITRFFTGHAETFKSLLRLADDGDLELHIVPQGILALALSAMGEGDNEVLTPAGIGTFVDPRTGRGTPLLPHCKTQHVRNEDGQLRFSIPKVDVALINAPAADRMGNIYSRGSAILAENPEAARAARRNGGKVIVNVGLLVDEGYGEVLLTADEVDAIVYYPGTEQTGAVKHSKPMDFLTLESKTSTAEGVARIRFVNHLLKVTPRRGPADHALARLGSELLAERAQPGDRVDIGTGLPEEVTRLLYESGLMDELQMMNESGVLGGVAAPGIYFGAAVNPTEMVSSAEAFRRMYDRLDWVVVGFLEVDAHGNVNASKRGDGAINYVGPGGFIDLTTAAKNVLFVGAWMHGAKYDTADDQLKTREPGKLKFIQEVDEITFSGAEALRRGQNVYYVTHVGVFALTGAGLRLMRIMPGVDLKRDILDACPFPISLPEDGEVPSVRSATLTGEGFKLSFGMATSDH